MSRLRGYVKAGLPVVVKTIFLIVEKRDRFACPLNCLMAKRGAKKRSKGGSFLLSSQTSMLLQDGPQ